MTTTRPTHHIEHLQSPLDDLEAMLTEIYSIQIQRIKHDVLAHYFATYEAHSNELRNTYTDETKQQLRRALQSVEIQIREREKMIIDEALDVAYRAVYSEALVDAERDYRQLALWVDTQKAKGEV